MTINYLDSKRISVLSADKIIPNSNRGTVTTDGSYTVITFTGDGTFTPESSFNVEYLIVAGGGGGGMNNASNGGGAGGGAGEMLENTSTNLTAGNYSVVVGTGGVGGTGVQNGGTKGVDSTWNSLTAEGGGAGAGARESDSILKNGGSGGSGGGGSPIESGTGGTGGTSQTGGNDGANATSNDNTNMRAGNGGGAGSAGVDSTGSSGSGGDGKSNSITGSAVNYASGGTGGWYFGMNTSASNTGAYGNGGQGRAGSAGSSGSASTGGNGVVILRFLTSGNTYETGTPTGGFPTSVQDNSILIEKDTGKRYWYDISAIELTTDAPFTTHATGWASKAYVSELADLPSVGDVVTGGKIYVGTSAGNVRLGLYSDNGSGAPQTLLAETASTAVGSAGAWQEIYFITPYTTTSTDKLHLGLQTDNTGAGFGYAVKTNARSQMTTSYGAFPTTFSGSEDSAPADLRATVATWTWDYVATRGVFAGANANTIMDYITIDTLGNATDFGDLTQGRWQSGGISSETRGVITGGALSGDVQVNTMDYVTIATTGNATDFGDLTTTRRGVAGVSNLTRGVTAGSTNVMDYITIATTGDAIDFGDLTISRIHLASVSSLTRGVFAGGGSSDSMDYITISTLGNAIDFGDLTVARTSFYGISSFTRGVFGGTYPTGNITMDYITIDTTGNAADFGDLTVARYAPAGVSSYFRGCFGGGNTSTDVNTIDYITIDTLGDAIDFGDLTVARPYSSGVQA